MGNLPIGFISDFFSLLIVLSVMHDVQLLHSLPDIISNKAIHHIDSFLSISMNGYGR